MKKREGEREREIKFPIKTGAVETTKIKASFFNIRIDTLRVADDRDETFQRFMEYEN